MCCINENLIQIKIFEMDDLQKIVLHHKKCNEKEK